MMETNAHHQGLIDRFRKTQEKYYELEKQFNSQGTIRRAGMREEMNAAFRRYIDAHANLLSYEYGVPKYDMKQKLLHSTYRAWGWEETGKELLKGQKQLGIPPARRSEAPDYRSETPVYDAHLKERSRKAKREKIPEELEYPEPKASPETALSATREKVLETYNLLKARGENLGPANIARLTNIPVNTVRHSLWYFRKEGMPIEKGYKYKFPKETIKLGGKEITLTKEQVERYNKMTKEMREGTFSIKKTAEEWGVKQETVYSFLNDLRNAGLQFPDEGYKIHMKREPMEAIGAEGKGFTEIMISATEAKVYRTAHELAANKIFDYKEIARRLGLAESTTKNYIQILRKKGLSMPEMGERTKHAGILGLFREYYLPIQQLEAIQHGFIDAEKGAKSSEELSKKMADLREHKYSLMKTKQLLSSRIPTDSIDAQIKKIDEVLNAVNPKKDQQTKLLMSEALYARRRAPIPGATGFETSGVSRELLRDSYDRDIEEARNQGKINRMQTMIKEKEEVIKRGRRKWKRG